MQGKRLLILGCGYLGKILVADAVGKGMRVLAVSRNLDTLAEAEKLGADVFKGMVDEDSWHGAAGTDVDFVVNCVSSAGGGLAGYRQSYIGGNESFGRWSVGSGFSGNAIYTSSVSVYGDADGAWVDEASAPPPANERGELVRESELAFLRSTEAASLSVLRLAGLYGPGRHLMLNKLKLAEPELAGWGNYFLNLVRIEDVASSVWAIFESERRVAGTFTVVDDEPSRKEEIVAWICSRLGIATPHFTGKPDASGRSSRRFGENGCPANRRIRNESLKGVVDWQPRFPSFREGFADLIDQ